VTGTQFAETISNYATPDCQGATTGDFAFDGTLELGEHGASAAVAGATDATITPNIDLFSCGAGMPGYTILKFDDTCSQFQTSTSTPPACDPADRPTAVDAGFFVKQ